MHGNKKDILILHGVSENQIYETLGKGNKTLKDSNSTDKKKARENILLLM